VRKPRNAKMKTYVAKKKILDHELEHLSYLLDYIDANPSYITRALEWSLSASTPENIDRSIRFEIEKIFRKEVEAQGRTFFGPNAMMRIALSVLELFSMARNPHWATRHEIEDFD